MASGSKFGYDRGELAGLVLVGLSTIQKSLSDNLDYPTTALHPLAVAEQRRRGRGHQIFRCRSMGFINDGASAVRATLDSLREGRCSITPSTRRWLSSTCLDLGVAEQARPVSLIPTDEVRVRPWSVSRNDTRVPVPPGYELGPDDFGAIRSEHVLYSTRKDEALT